MHYLVQKDFLDCGLVKMDFLDCDQARKVGSVRAVVNKDYSEFPSVTEVYLECLLVGKEYVEIGEDAKGCLERVISKGY